jgi:hypothetical protein
MTKTATAVRDRDIEMRLNDIRGDIRKILDDKCMFRIQEVRGEGFPHTVINPTLDVAGLCNMGAFRVEVHPSLEIEMNYVAVMAHEYTHVWQAMSDQFKSGGKEGDLDFYDEENPENRFNVPFRGKLIVEGSANWGAYKVLDYYAADDCLRRLHPSQPDSFAAHPNFDQYWLGFLLCLHIETHYSFVELLHFLETGELHYRQPKFMRGPGYEEASLEAPSMYNQIYRDPRCAIFSELSGEMLVNQPEETGYRCLTPDHMTYPFQGEGKEMDSSSRINRFTYLADPQYAENPPVDFAPSVQSDGFAAHVAKCKIGSLLADRAVGQAVGDCLRQELRATGCFDCSMDMHCSVREVCHVHASGDRQASGLQKKVVDAASQ